MKLKTSLTASRDGSLVDATDENLIHDTGAAHALMLSLGQLNAEQRGWIEDGADELMREWGFDSGEDVA